MSTALIKISLLFQYLRIFDRGRMRLFCIALIVLVGLWGTAYTLLAWFPCSPVYGYWTWTESNTCWAYGSIRAAEFYATYTSHAVLNMVFDFIVLAIPIQLYFRHDTIRSARIRLLALLSMGTLVSSISIWRLIAILEHRAATWPTFDPTWYGPAAVTLGMVEVNAASICACVPVFWPVLTARLDMIFVTQEVEITRERRFSDKEDEIELSGSGTHSRADSQASQTQLNLLQTAKPTTTHYMDDYIMDQVDPLRSKTSMAVSSEAISKTVERRRSQRTLLRQNK